MNEFAPRNPGPGVPKPPYTPRRPEDPGDYEGSTGTHREPSVQHEQPGIFQRIGTAVARFFANIFSFFGYECEGKVCTRISQNRVGVYQIQQGTQFINVYGCRVYFVFSELNSCCIKKLYKQRHGFWLWTVNIGPGGNEQYSLLPAVDLNSIDADLVPDDTPLSPGGILMPDGDGEWDDTPGVDVPGLPNCDLENSITVRAVVEDSCNDEEIKEVTVFLHQYLVVRGGTVDHARSFGAIQVLSGDVC